MERWKQQAFFDVKVFNPYVCLILCKKYFDHDVPTHFVLMYRNASISRTRECGLAAGRRDTPNFCLGTMTVTSNKVML